MWDDPIGIMLENKILEFSNKVMDVLSKPKLIKRCSGKHLEFS